MVPIPEYPVFRRLEIGDRAVIEAITRQFPPYSDFSFTSLYSWDIDQLCMISMLGGNLIVRFKNYVTDAHFYSFIGHDAVVETAATLLEHARQEGLPSELRLVPETVIAADERLARCFSVAADRDNDDYVHAVEDWARFSGAGFREHRRLLARCRERANLDARVLALCDPVSQDAIRALFHRWAQQKPPLQAESHQAELFALQRVFDLSRSDRLEACGIYDGSCLVGLSIWEDLWDGYAVIHFQKADQTYRGLSSLQAHEMGRLLQARGCHLVNGEQDLGIWGLRGYKRSLQPCHHLRKFVVAKRAKRIRPAP
jgi:hypothetical protein